MFNDYGTEQYEKAQRFRDPGGESALYPGKRIYPCPTCGMPNKLTAKDVKAGYQCDNCANGLERGY